MSYTILIQPIGDVDRFILDSLGQELKRALGVFVEVSYTPIPIPEEAYDPRRDQYISEKVLNYLGLLTQAIPHDRILGIAEFDAYSPPLNFVFGQAEVSGRLAVVYLPRLRPEFYGQLPNKRLFRLRVLKEALHELGHTFGLDHCSNPSCVMTFSNSIMDTDRKEAAYCYKCAGRLRRKGIRVRYVLE
ncbi:MAG: archemetzincin [Thermoprotei archaeon]|nr:MAG: archemetzincin [Thermoprotei archaeon]RLF23603.1 MAG: archemetzincin [Thermoprotei archaeon]